MTPLADLHTFTLATTRTIADRVWGYLGEPITAVWAAFGAMPLPVALAAVAVAEAIDQRRTR